MAWACCNDDGVCGNCGGTPLGHAKIKLADAAIAYYLKEAAAREQDEAYARGEGDIDDPRPSTEEEHAAMWKAMQEAAAMVKR